MHETAWRRELVRGAASRAGGINKLQQVLVAKKGPGTRHAVIEAVIITR